jgi:transglutaminase-like putative cysteine protease
MQLGNAKLGDEGDEGKEPSPLELRVYRSGGVCREMKPVGIQILTTRVTKVESHHRWSRVWERRWVSRDAACGNANLGDEGDEGKGPSSLEPRVEAVVGVERCSGNANLGDGSDEGKEPSSLEPRVACGSSGGGCREMRLGNANLGDKGDEGNGSSHRWKRVWERRWVPRDATWECKAWRQG